MRKKNSRVNTLARWAGAEPRELKQLTVLFTDIIGSTRKSYEIGDARWIEKLIRHFSHARDIKRHYRCFEIKIIGDSFMVAFHNAYDALNFSIEFLKNTGDEDIKIRVGINSGAVRIIDNDIYGGTVNYAARVMSSQELEGIALSQSAKEHIQYEIGDLANQVFEPKEHEFKDYPIPRTIWHVKCDEYWQLKIKQDFPSLADINMEIDSMKYQIDQAKEDDLDWFSTIEREAYGLDAVPLELLRSWYKKNPAGFFIIKTENGQKVGHIDMLPLRSADLNLLLEGEIIERDINADAVFTVAERSQIRDLYIESVIISTSKDLTKASILRHLLAEFEVLVSKICDPTNLNNIYAMAATFAGRKLMKDLGFEIIKDGSDRLDGHPFYKANYNNVIAIINNILGE